MLYDPSADPLLSDDAKALVTSDLAAFTAQAELAESLLGLDTDPDYTADPADAAIATKATRAVALQVNYQVAAGIEAFTQSTDRPSEIRVTFRGSNEMPTLHPMARDLAEQARNDYAAAHVAISGESLSGWSSVRGVR